MTRSYRSTALPLLALLSWKHVHASSITATYAYEFSHWTTLQIGYEDPLFVKMMTPGLYIILSKGASIYYVRKNFGILDPLPPLVRSQG